LSRGDKSSVKEDVNIPLDQWTPWHTESLIIPFEGNALIGLGAGEKRIEKDLFFSYGVNARPKSTSHGNSIADLVIDDAGVWSGDWEVKEISHGSLSFRAGVTGGQAAYEITSLIVTLTDEIMKFMIEISGKKSKTMMHEFREIKRHTNKPKNKKEREANKHQIPPTFDEIYSIVEEINLSAKRGNISNGRVVGCTAQSPIALWQIVDAFYGISDEIQKLSDAFFKAWNYSSLPSIVFGHVKGLIITNVEDGYVMIEKSKIDDHLIFDCVSKNLLRFEVRKR